LFIDIFKGKIKTDVANGIKGGIEKAINNNLNHVLTTLNLKENIQNKLLADFTLVGNPRFADYMVLDLKGELYNIKNPQEAPFTPVPLPDIQSTNVMFQFSIAQYTPDSAGFALWKAGDLTFQVDDSKIPKESPIRFNTDSFQFIVPELFNKFGSKNLSAITDPIKSPIINFGAGGVVAISLPYELKMFVDVSSTNKTYVFNVGVNIDTTGKVSMSNQMIQVNLTYANISLYLIESKIGPIDIAPLKDIALLVTSYMIPFANQYLSKGIPLPIIKGVTFINPYLGFGNGFIFVNTDVHYTPQKEGYEFPGVLELF